MNFGFFLDRGSGSKSNFLIISWFLLLCFFNSISNRFKQLIETFVSRLSASQIVKNYQCIFDFTDQETVLITIEI